MGDVLKKINALGGIVFILEELFNEMGLLEKLITEKGKPLGSSSNIEFVYAVIRLSEDNNLMLGKYISYGFHYELYNSGSSWINLHNGENIVVPEPIPVREILLVYKCKYLFIKDLVED